MKKQLVLSGLVFFLALFVSTLFTDGASTIASAAGPEFLGKSLDGEAIPSFQDSLEKHASLGNKKLTSGGLYPAPKLEKAELVYLNKDGISLSALPSFHTNFNGKFAGISAKNDFIFYTLDNDLQAYAKELVKKAGAPHVAVVAMDPGNGRILAIADKSSQIPNLALHAGFPAASLFKVVTTAAGLETNVINPETQIRFRGGTYTLNKYNYLPVYKKDRRVMTVTEALGLSCNAVFGRIALQHLSPSILRRFVDKFGFNSELGFDVKLPKSSAVIPDSDYELSRTAAGFGEVRISPIHAAALMAAVANEGYMPKPHIVSSVLSQNGDVKYQSSPQMLKQIVSSRTANTLLKMMEATTLTGTSRSEFIYKKKKVLPVSVAAKTGTLSGNNPKGLNQWFIAAAPIENPKIAISVISVNPSRTSAKASRLGRQLIQKYLDL